MGCEHPLTTVRAPNVPELHIAILKGGGKSEVVPNAELDVPHALRLACGQNVNGEDEGDSPLGTPGGRVTKKGSLERLWTLQERPHRHNSLGWGAGHQTSSGFF